jgi:hypothetical protein
VTGVAGRECLDEASTTFWCEEMLKVNRPCADRLSICRVLRKDNKSAYGPQGGADPIDIGYDCTSHRRFGHLARGHEAVLQIDDNVRRAARAQTVKHRDATTAEDEALSDFVEDTQLMHGFTTLLMIGSASRTFAISHFKDARAY